MNPLPVAPTGWCRSGRSIAPACHLLARFVTRIARTTPISSRGPGHEQLRQHGHRPHYVPVSGTTPVSCLRCVCAGFELADQVGAAGLRPDALYVPFGTGGIAAGIAVGLHAAGRNAALIGCSVNRPAANCAEQFDALVSKIQTLLHSPLRP